MPRQCYYTYRCCTLNLITGEHSRLDYANSVLYNTSSGSMLKLQRVQNSLASVVTFRKRAEHIDPLLHQLHWLPIDYRISHQVATLPYKVRWTGSSAYLLPSVSDFAPTGNPHNTYSTYPSSGRRYLGELSATHHHLFGMIYLLTFTDLCHSTVFKQQYVRTNFGYLL